MKLISFSVTEYKSVENSGLILVDDVTCLVGKNESGKTALLEALRCTNPVSGQDGAFTLEDFPRRRSNEYKRRHPTSPSNVITAHFEIESSDRTELDVKFGLGVVGNKVSVSRGYDNKTKIELTIDEAAYVRTAVSRLNSREADDLRTIAKIDDFKQKLRELEDPPSSVTELLSEIDKDSRTSIESAARTFIEAHLLPHFFYFDEYAILPGTIALTKLKNSELKRTKGQDGEMSPEEVSARALIELVGASIDEFLDESNYERLKADLEAASNAITDEIFKYWRQNCDLEVEFDIQPKHDSNKVLQETYLHIRIKNLKHRVTVPFDKRSKGFVWFFSFLVAFSRYSDDKRMILLLDEPGLNLHAKAQGDLLRYFEEKLAKGHQIIYSTHSPFMVPPTKLERVRTVQDVVNKGTVVSGEVWSTDADTIFPLQAALGYDLAQTLFVGPNQLLVEGPSDLIYLGIARELLRASGGEALSEKWVIVPVGGADKISTFVALLGGNQLNIAVLMDVSKSEAQRCENLLRSSRLNRQNLVTIGNILERASADIEDMLEPTAYLELVSATYENDLQKKALMVSDLSQEPRIVKRIEAYFKQHCIAKGHFDHFAPARRALEHPSWQAQLFSNSALEYFEKMFKQLNSLLA